MKLNLLRKKRRPIANITIREDVSFGIQSENIVENDSAEEVKPEEVMIKCPKCGKMVSRKRVVKRKYICYECGGYFRVKTSNRIKMVADPGSFIPWFESTDIQNPLSFEGYEEKLTKLKNDTGLDEAVTVGSCNVYGKKIAEYAIEQGWKTCVVTTSAEGDTSDQPRYDALKEAFEAAGGTILATVNNDSTDVSLENVRNASRLHKRCGTSFMFFVVFISVIVFIFIRVDDPIMRVVIRLLLIPVIASVSYEIIRLAGRTKFFLVQILSAPGLLLQKLTTREPDDDMIETAIASVEAVFDWREYLSKEFGYEYGNNHDFY